MSLPLVLPRFDLLRAARAIAALMNDPDDLPQVFTVIDALDGTAPHRLYLRFRATRAGARLLRDKPDIVPILADREALAKLPDGTLGRAYLAFVESEGISAEGIMAASADGTPERTLPPSLAYLRCRMRDTHDLWHAATGYRGDVVGELALLAFGTAQHWNTGVALIVAAGLVKGLGRDEVHVIRDGFRRGRAAAWMPAQEWETLLPLPLAEVRRRLRLGDTPDYVPVRTEQLRAEGVVGKAA